MFLQNEKYKVDISCASAMIERESGTVLNPGKHALDELSKAFVVRVSGAVTEYQLSIAA